jgi:hypothetical protein
MTKRKHKAQYQKNSGNMNDIMDKNDNLNCSGKES